MVGGLAALLVGPGGLCGQGGAVSGLVRVSNALSRGAVVYLISESANPLPPAAEAVLLDQRNLSFVPRTLLVPPGQEVAFRNSDPLLHNVFSPDYQGEDFNLGTYPSGESRTHVFKRPGTHVILCHIHPEMEAYVFVNPARFHSVVDDDGLFLIENIPEGEYTLHVWHPRAVAYRRAVRIGANNWLRLDIQLERRRAGGRN